MVWLHIPPRILAAGEDGPCSGSRSAPAPEDSTSAVLVARMEEAALDPAPVWDDLATFDGRPWRGAVDIVLAGYPCQPFSVAGRRRAPTLNPLFVEALMGWPIGWTGFASAATAWSPWLRRMRGELSRLGWECEG